MDSSDVSAANSGTTASTAGVVDALVDVDVRTTKKMTSAMLSGGGGAVEDDTTSTSHGGVVLDGRYYPVAALSGTALSSGTNMMVSDIADVTMDLVSIENKKLNSKFPSSLFLGVSPSAVSSESVMSSASTKTVLELLAQEGKGVIYEYYKPN